ncbi:ABC transporter substrate-binding protein, partial [Treponema endosymbiont of Eucomonympha sp.]|uniref:ABC transporter substrate-binding protein n=1 Tax=Treponema endosymbiont of Eucomonympha sp. TaxID=1580831 RepID=UPI000ABC527D
MKAVPAAFALFPALLLRRRAQAFAALVLGALLLALAALSGCGKPARRTISDRAGETAVVPEHIERIVSTAPSNTEIIVDLGLADKLVAVDRYSRDIPGVRQDLPQIDFFYPDGEALISLRPDLIIVNGHNRTGAGGDPFALLREAGIAV